MKSIVVIGTGTMASGIAAGFISQSVPVIILGRSKEKADSCLQKALELSQKIGFSGNYDGQSMGAIKNLQASEKLDDWNQWGQSQWVVETITEDLLIKQELFKKLDHLVPEHIPIGSNSSGFPITKISKGLKTANRMFGAHYFMPAEIVPLVEIVLGERSDEKMAQQVVTLYRDIKKKPVLVKKDIPGFLANRIQHALMREALSLVDSGIATPEDIDDAVRFSFGFRYAAVGPMTQKEISGWDGMANAAKEIYPSLSNIDSLPKTLQTLMNQGKTGMKAGEGFRKWSAPEIKEIMDSYGKRLKAAFDVLNMK